jgi:hypothetical protein
VRCTNDSREEVPGERKPVLRDCDDDKMTVLPDLKD